MFAGNLKVIVGRRLEGCRLFFEGRIKLGIISCKNKHSATLTAEDNDDYFNGKRLTN